MVYRCTHFSFTVSVSVFIFTPHFINTHRITLSADLSRKICFLGAFSLFMKASKRKQWTKFDRMMDKMDLNYSARGASVHQCIIHRYVTLIKWNVLSKTLRIFLVWRKQNWKKFKSSILVHVHCMQRRFMSLCKQQHVSTQLQGRVMSIQHCLLLHETNVIVAHIFCQMNAI